MATYTTGTQAPIFVGTLTFDCIHRLDSSPFLLHSFMGNLYMLGDTISKIGLFLCVTKHFTLLVLLCLFGFPEKNTQVSVFLRVH